MPLCGHPEPILHTLIKDLSETTSLERRFSGGSQRDRVCVTDQLVFQEVHTDRYCLSNKALT